MTAFVIDIGTTKTTCIAAKMEDGELRVVSAAAVGTRGIKRGKVSNLESLNECVRIAVERVREETGVAPTRVVINVPGLSVKSEMSRGMRLLVPSGKEVHKEDMLQVNEHSRQVRFGSGFEILQALPCTYTIDTVRRVSDPLGEKADRLEVETHLMSGESSELRRLESTVTQLDLKVTELVPGALASGLGVMTSEDADKGCIVIDIGGGTSDAAVFEGGSCTKVATINVSSQHITNDVATLLKISKEDAENLKLTKGNADLTKVAEDDVVNVKQVGNDAARPFPCKVLCEIIESRSREIATMLKNELIGEEPDRKLPSTILLTGGGSHLDGIDTVFKKVFGVDKVRLAYPKLGGTNSRRVGVPEMSAAVGLALFALEEGSEELAPVAGAADWKERIRSLKSIFSAKS